MNVSSYINYVKKILFIAIFIWSISYCPNNITKRVDSGNEDHCCPCGQYDLKNNMIKTENIKKIIPNKITKDTE